MYRVATIIIGIRSIAELRISRNVGRERNIRHFAVVFVKVKVFCMRYIVEFIVHDIVKRIVSNEVIFITDNIS